MPGTFLFFWFIVLSFSFLPFDTARSQSSITIKTEDVLKVRLFAGPNRQLDKTIQWQVLDLALQKSGRAYNLGLSKHNRAPGRAAKLMQELGDEANIIYAGPDPVLENTLQMVRIPIFRGLMSYWQIFVREKDVARFSHVETLDDLKSFSILQGERYKPISAFAAAGFDSRFAYLPNLTRMVAGERADMMVMPTVLSKSMSRFNSEQLGIVPLPDIMLHIPSDHFFYTAKSGAEELNNAIASGLTAAIADGSYSTLISTHPLTGDSYDKLMQGDFKLLHLDNPYLSEEIQELLADHSPELHSPRIGKKP